MSILGAIVRTHLARRADTAARLRGLPGVSIEHDPGDGRLIVIIEDLPEHDASARSPLAPASAAEALNAIAQWPEVLSASLVYEYSGPDAPPPTALPEVDFKSWRASLAASTRTAGPSPSRSPE